MVDGIYVAGSAMVRGEQRQAALAHNLANVSTPGFKAARVFSKVLREVGRSIDLLRDVQKSQQLYIDFSQGFVHRTGRALDLALEGNGFFVVRTPRGERFTRNGNFSLNVSGQLVDQSGFPVLSENGPITLTGGTVLVDEKGQILLEGEPVGTLAIRQFASLAPLVPEGRGLFGPCPGSELQQIESSTRVLQGSLEASNVIPMEEMVRMTSLLRNYESCQRMLQMQNSAVGRLVNELIFE